MKINENKYKNIKNSEARPYPLIYAGTSLKCEISIISESDIWTVIRVCESGERRRAGDDKRCEWQAVNQSSPAIYTFMETAAAGSPAPGSQQPSEDWGMRGIVLS